MGGRFMFERAAKNDDDSLRLPKYQVDQAVRNAVILCWASLEEGEKTLDGLKNEFQRFYLRALNDFADDNLRRGE